jgi:tetratricopeptide (TPR) repeat protein
MPATRGLEHRWSFEDGTGGVGPVQNHVFPKTGWRKVTLEVREKDVVRGRLAQLVYVQPNWSQREEWRDTIFARQKKELLAADWAPTPVEDLRALVRLAERLEDHEVLTHLGEVCLQRQSAFAAAEADTFFLLGFHYESPEVRAYPKAEQAWQAAIQLGLSTLQDKARLQWARHRLEIAGQAQAALDLLARLNEAALDEKERRWRKILRGDALLLQGKVDQARQAYAGAGTLVNELNRAQESRSRAQLESAKDHVRRGEYGRAEDMLRQIEWEMPLERLSIETGLASVKIYLGRKEYPRALTRCLQLLPVAIVDTDQADLLYHLVQIYLALGQETAADATLAKLLKEHPYSEATALAKDKWGGRAAPKPGYKAP